MRFALIPFALLVGCTPPEETEAPGPEDVNAFPEIWGHAEMEDHDPAEDVVEVHLEAAKTDLALIDGQVAKVWTYNGLFPGPLVQANVGDTVRVILDNNLEEPTTIHWHGLRIPDEMDGVPAVQEPVEVGGTFEYEFVVPDSGSYWYHPHVRSNVQIERGLQGPLIVHEENPPAYDRNRYFVLDDIAVDEEGNIVPANPMSHPDQMHGRHGNVLLANGSADLLTDEVAHGTRERWRIVNSANARFMHVGVTGADWRVIGIDGTLLPEPLDPGDEPWLLPVGRRLDLEVVPRDVAELTKLRIELDNGSGFDRFPVFEGTVVGDDLSPGFIEWDQPALPEILPVEQEVHLAFNVQAGATTTEWTINGLTFDESEPIQVQGNVPTKITIEEQSGFPHPYHLHGEFFQVMSRTTLDIEPGLQDTTAIEGFETVELYTTFSNPGTWMTHCHILEHAELGMMAIIEVSE